MRDLPCAVPIYISAASGAQATQLAAKPGTRLMGGGTDLLTAMEVGLDPATTLVDLTKASDLTQIVESRDRGLRIGAAVRLDDIARHPMVRASFPLLSHAVNSVGTPALRAMGTLGGNLAQRPRCWYLRARLSCLKNGSSGCPAATGENQYHAIISSGQCCAAHPSDAAVALLALDASIVVRGATGTRTLTVAELFHNAASNPARETSLVDGELIEAVVLPEAAANGLQRFTKLMQRGAWDFATVSLAAARRRDGTTRFVLGGVAAGPWRVNSSIEEDVASGALDEDSADALAARALHDATPLSQNGYKMQQATALLTRAMLDLSQL